MGIDEHFFTRKEGYATTLMDLKNHKVFDVVLGRSEASLRAYLKRLQGRDRVQVVVMDLSETYRSIIQKYFPNARIVADRFHVVRLLNHHFLKVWRMLDPDGRKNRGLLSLVRRHEENLKPEQVPKLQNYLNQTPGLEPIVRMWRFTKNNGITEGFHTKMEMISRRAYGFRNFKNYRLRVIALCGWDGVFAIRN